MCFSLVAPSKRSDISGHYGVCMYVCRDVVLLDNCLTEKSITYIHKGIFFNCRFGMTKVNPPLPPKTESDKIPAHFDHFLELNNASTGQI